MSLIVNYKNKIINNSNRKNNDIAPLSKSIKASKVVAISASDLERTAATICIEKRRTLTASDSFKAICTFRSDAASSSTETSSPNGHAKVSMIAF
jgi:hypothetical protein